GGAGGHRQEEGGNPSGCPGRAPGALPGGQASLTGKAWPEKSWRDEKPSAAAQRTAWRKEGGEGCGGNERRRGLHGMSPALQSAGGAVRVLRGAQERRR